MKFRGLLAAVVILLILGGVLYWSEHRKPSDSAAATSASATPAIVKIDPAAVTSLTVKQKDAKPVTLLRSSPSVWRITAPVSAPADSSIVSAMLSSLAPLTSQRVIENNSSDLSQYGLSHPIVELDIVGKNNKTTQLSLGDTTPTGDAVYVAVAGDPRVFTAPSYITSSLNKSLTDLRDKRLVPVESSAVNSIELMRKGQGVSFSRVQNGWQIEKPKTYRTDTYQVDDLLQQVTGAKWDPATSTEDAAKAWAHATPVASVKLTANGGTQTLEVRKSQDSDYAQSSAVQGIYKVDPSISTGLSEALNRGLDDFRNKQLFEFGYNDPDKIEYHSGATNLVLTHTGNAWWSNSTKMDAESVESLVTAFRDLAASKFVDSGFTKPETDVTVTSNGGKRIEKVQLQTTKDGAIAKRDDGPSLYSLDSVAMENLNTAVKGIKPAVPTKK